MLKIIILCVLFINAHAELNNIVKDVRQKELQDLIGDLVNMVAARGANACVTVLCDPVYLNIFEGPLFDKLHTATFVFFLASTAERILKKFDIVQDSLEEHIGYLLFYDFGGTDSREKIVVAENEDLLFPNYHTLEGLRHAKKERCGTYFIILANGLQAGRLLKFGDRYRLLNTRAKYIMLHDIRLFKSNLQYIWKRMVNVVFLRHHNTPQNKIWFDLSAVPFPNTIREVLITRRIEIWRNGKFHYNRDLFADKTKNLNGETLNVAYLEHVPSVLSTYSNDTKIIGGIEIEILNTIASKMNFKPKLYQAADADHSKWGEKLPNGSYSGLLGELVTGQADIAVGNLQYTTLYHEMTDLSIPYTSQCWTFLTPEAISDNSWKTLILPFKLYMWIAVLMVLLVTGSIFFGLAKYYIHLMDFREESAKSRSTEMKKALTSDTRPGGLYLFGEITNSILYTYGMLLVVSLPKLPSGWSIRLLTGWYWLYCILLVVSYKASMTAILANPTPRVTIDTLKELVDSKITCGGWGQETKRFFVESLDDIGQKIVERYETIDDPDAAAKRVVRGDFAFYDNKNYLKYLRVKRKNKINIDRTNASLSNDTWFGNTSTERNLHIMSDCMVNIPVSIGFHKNSPLKPLADIYLRRIVEVGLLEKWSNDAMYKIKKLDTNEEEIKALMNLKKLHGAFIALAIGYFISFLVLISELMHWQYIVKKDPLFDKYAVDLYYVNKNKKH